MRTHKAPDQDFYLRRPKTGAAPFALDELFFSRTNDRGIIEAANPVFQRVAHFNWERLIGAPHKIIRHPDMPRAVFWLLWDRLKKNQPVAAYVKNQAADGLHYWVLASVTPLEGGGYISVRIKPVCGLLAPVEAAYAALRARELEEGLDPEVSAGLLIEAVQSLGFFDYDHFMSEALFAEVGERPFWVDAKHRVVIEGLKNLPELWNSGRKLKALWGGLRYTLTNMRLMAAKLEINGKAIDLMAQNYTTVLAEAETWLGQFMTNETGDLARVTQAARGAGLALGLAHMQRLAVRQFSDETLPPEAGCTETEMAILTREADRRALLAQKSLASIQSYAATLDRMSTEIRRSCVGLNSTRMMCKAEAARHDTETSAFGAVVDALDAFQHEVEACADEMVQHVRAVSAMIESGRARREPIKDRSRDAPFAASAGLGQGSMGHAEMRAG